MSKKYFLNLIQPNRKTGLLERCFPPLPPITPINLPSRLICLFPFLPFRYDLFVFSEETVEGCPQLFNFVDELEFWLDLIGDGSKDRVSWRVLE